MVLAAHRAYAQVKRATRAARPPRVARVRMARRALGGTFVAGTGVLGLIAVVSPGNFGQPGATTARTGWPFYLLIALISCCILLGVINRAQLVWLGSRLREPLLRPLDDHPSFSDAADALAACPGPVRMRWAIGWVWGPIAWAVAGTTFAFSSAYFLVDALLARFRVGWAQPLYALAFAALSLFVFALAAGRLSTWRFAASVNKEVTTGYIS
jgi:hypothetical protein